MTALLEMMIKTQEAQAVRLGLPVRRQYSDADLADSIDDLAAVEAELYGKDPRNEGCDLSTEERRMLDDLGRQLLPFDVTVTSSEGIETLRIIAHDAIAANVQAVELLFGDSFAPQKPQKIKIKVEPVRLPDEPLNCEECPFSEWMRDPLGTGDSPAELDCKKFECPWGKP